MHGAENTAAPDGAKPNQLQYVSDSLGFFNGRVSHVFWYSLHDENATEGDFGLVGADMQPRQVYTALQEKL
jgi:hypothetical protein